MVATNMLRTAVILGLFAVIGAGLVSFTFVSTEERIAESERQYLLRLLHTLIPPQGHDNDLFTDTIEVTDPDLLGSTETGLVYRARQQGAPVAAVLSVIAPDGYSGDIKLLVAVNYDGTVAGVRVLQHRETPGLGDAIEAERSDWILAFNGRSLGNPPKKSWKVKRDGGVFDQLTGATITPRAVVNAVYNALRYFQQHRDTLFAVPEPPAAETAAATHTEPQAPD